MQKPHLTLYHGTDARILSMSKTERAAYFSDVDLALDYLWTIWEPICHKMVIRKLWWPNGEFKGTTSIPYIESIKQQFVDAGKGRLHEKVYRYVSMADWSKQGAPKYQYGSLYLTALKGMASTFANDAFAGGERGEIVYYMLEGAAFLGISLGHPEEKIVRAIQTIKAFAEGPREPIVVILNDVDPKYLLAEGGKSADFSVELVMKAQKEGRTAPGANFRYMKDVDLSRYPFERV